MNRRVFKVHTDTLGRLSACMQHAMYGVSKKAFTQQMPIELKKVSEGDLVFISEREVHKNVLFGPFYATANRQGVAVKSCQGLWADVNPSKSSQGSLPYWAIMEGYTWCLYFDQTLADRVSVVWPNQWSSLRVDLPPWGLVRGEDAEKLVEYAAANETEAKEFFVRHGIQ